MFLCPNHDIAVAPEQLLSGCRRRCQGDGSEEAAPRSRHGCPLTSRKCLTRSIRLLRMPSCPSPRLPQVRLLVLLWSCARLNGWVAPWDSGVAIGSSGGMPPISGPGRRPGPTVVRQGGAAARATRCLTRTDRSAMPGWRVGTGPIFSPIAATPLDLPRWPTVAAGPPTRTSDPPFDWRHDAGGGAAAPASTTGTKLNSPLTRRIVKLLGAQPPR